VKVVEVAAGGAADTLALPGVIRADETATLRPEATGLVAWIGFEDGDVVAAGAPLVRLRSEEADAGLAEADARWSLAESVWTRTEALAAHGNASAFELEQARAQRALAVAARARAREAVRKTTLRAPFRGVVGRRGVALGELVDPARVVAQLDALDAVTVEVSAPERYLGGLAVGAAAEVQVEAVPGRTFAGVVSYLAPRIAEGTRTAELSVRVDNADHTLRAGLSATVSLSLGPLGDVIAVPSQAVVVTAAGASVWVVDDASLAQPRPVTVGARDAAEVRVVDGLSPGERVIVEGLLRLKPGAPVRILP
jgi:membrane fusion protein (multidrug efflux system)